MTEVWKEVKGWEGRYEVSNLGQVRSLFDNHGNPRIEPRMLKPTNDRYGYLRVGLHKDGKKILKLVHRLVAEVFLANPLNFSEVNHKDEVKTNNLVFLDEEGSVIPEKSNLEWVSHLDNMRYGSGIERRAKARKGKFVNHPDFSKRVLQFDRDGTLIREWLSTMEVERQTGWHNTCISACCRGKQKTAYEHVWKYASE